MQLKGLSGVSYQHFTSLISDLFEISIIKGDKKFQKEIHLFFAVALVKLFSLHRVHFSVACVKPFSLSESNYTVTC